MKACNGRPAEQDALAYVEGSLSEAESARFEEHFFGCAVCTEQVVELQRVMSQLRGNPVDVQAVQGELRSAGGERWRGFWRPNPAWGVLALASLVLVAVLILRTHWQKTDSTGPTTVAGTGAGATTGNQQGAGESKGAATTSPQVEPKNTTAQILATQLADLTLPTFVAPNLREESDEVHFLSGMSSYTAGDCAAAVESLKLVPASVREARAARFYSGSCELHSGKFAEAKRDLKTVVDAGDSPQLESALYELAQAALAENDAATARSYLQKTIAMRGDLETKARTEDDRVAELLQAAQNPAANLKK